VSSGLSKLVLHQLKKEIEDFLIEKQLTKPIEAVNEELFETMIEAAKWPLNKMTSSDPESLASHSKNIKPVYRYPRSYGDGDDDRITLLLRHIARLLYFKWKIEQQSLEEVQEKQEVKSIFISYSPKDYNGERTINNNESLYDFITKEVEMEEIPIHLVKKFGKNTKRAFEHSRLRLENLLKKESKIVKDISKMIKSKGKAIIEYPSDNKRHAEEYLCDQIEKNAKNKDTTYYIFGKRRPCMTCFGWFGYVVLMTNLTKIR